MGSQRLDLSHRRHEAIAKFIEDNQELFGITAIDDIGEGPFIVMDWAFVLHLRDLSVEDHSYAPNEVRAAFFRPGMGYSAKLGMIAALDEGVRYPRQVEDDDEDED